MLLPQHNSVQLFKSCAGARMIKPILVMLCDLLGWWFLKIVLPSWLSSSSCHLKQRNPSMFWTEALAMDPFSSPFMTAKFDCTIDFEEAFIRNPSNQKKILYHLWNLHEGLSLLMVSNSFVQHVAWEMFSPSRFELFISILSHAKCVNNKGTKLNGINLPKYGSMVTKYVSTHSQNERYAPKIYHYLLMTRTACDQLRVYFLCDNYVSVFYHKSRLYSKIFLNLELRQHKTSIFTSLCQCHNYS